MTDLFRDYVDTLPPLVAGRDDVRLLLAVCLLAVSLALLLGWGWLRYG